MSKPFGVILLLLYLPALAAARAPTLNMKAQSGVIALAWDIDATVSSPHFEVQRRPDPRGAWVRQVEVTETHWVDYQAHVGKRYCYRVRTRVGSRLSSWTRGVCGVAR